MTWREHHERSDAHAWDADIAKARGDIDSARRSFALAAQAEETAIGEISPNKARTYGVTVVSAASLYREAQLATEAERVAHTYLASGLLPEFAKTQLRELLHALWDEQARAVAGIDLAEQPLQFSVRGEMIFRGVAPLLLIEGIAKRVESMLYRVAELEQKYNHRLRGQPSKEIKSLIQPWLVQSAPGSYQFAITLRRPIQPPLLQAAEEPLAPARILERLMEIMQMSAKSPEDGLPQLVSDDAYRRTFLTLTRDLAPRGSTYQSLVISREGQSTDLILSSETRFSLNEAIRNIRRSVKDVTVELREYRGTLRAVDLNRDSLRLDTGKGECRINGVGDAVDDVIGPMMNRPVIVTAQPQLHSHPQFIDIEPDD